MQNYIIRLFGRFNQYRIQRLSNRNFLIIAAIIVGVCSGLAASILKLLTHHIASFLKNDVEWKYKYYLFLFFPLIGIFLAVTYVKRFIRKDKFETGLTPILYAISNRSSRLSFHNTYSHIITSALTIGFGGSTGLEAPVVTTGASIGSNISRIFNLNYRETTMLLACGAAAGIAGAFGSPVTGILFAMEVLLPEFSIPAFIPLIIAAVSASIVGRLFHYQQMFILPTNGWVMEALVFYVLMAILIGFFSIYVTKITYWIKDQFKKMKSAYGKVLTGGLLLGLFIFLFPTLFGEGYLAISDLLYGDYSSIVRNSVFREYSTSIPWIILFSLATVFAKSMAALITLSAGGNGGMFGPSLVMGGLLGFVFAFSVNQTGWIELRTANFIVAGMAAALSGIMQAPLTGVFLIAEITGGYVLMVPLMLVSCISYFINKAVLKHSMYTKVLAERGELLSHADRDSIILRMMKLKFLIDKGFVGLHPDDLPANRSEEIVHSNRNVFPVLSQDQTFHGIVYVDQLFEVLLQKDSTVTVGSLMQNPPALVYEDEPMVSVMAKLDKDDIWVLPVVSKEGKYAGFVSKTTIFNKYRALMLRQKEYLQ